MERGSDKHSPRLDEALEGEVRSMLHAGHETREQEGQSSEPSGEDQPAVDLSPDAELAGGTPEGMTGADLGERAELASYLGKGIWPADSNALVEKAQSAQAPDRVVERLRDLPPGERFENMAAAWAALTGEVEDHRF
jgi:hypothetical protein